MNIVKNLRENILPSLGKSLGMGLLLCGLCMVGSCGDDKEDIVPGSVAERLTSGNDTRPTTWTNPDYSLFELTMSLQVELGDTLASYQSERDLMCATIDGEVRAVANPMTTGDVTYFALSIAGNGGNQTISLQYYCDRLHRIYTITNWTTFDASVAPTGTSGIYRPKFINQ